MATDRQVQANRANAKRSSGPKSERGKRAVALNAVKHGLSMPLASALCQPDDQEDPALQAIAELIAAECNSPGSARHIASTILEFERNETAQREFFMSCCAQPQGVPAGAQLIEAVRQLRGECGERQVADARIALAHGTGGTLGVAHSGATLILARD